MVFRDVFESERKIEVFLFLLWYLLEVHVLLQRRQKVARDVSAEQVDGGIRDTDI